MKELKKGLLQQCWSLFTSVRFAIILLILLAMDLCYAYLSVNGYTTVLEPMNRLGLWLWLSTFGVRNLQHTSWFFILLFLLFFLAINITICTGDRLLRLKRKWRRHGQNKRIYFSLSTHIMHLGIVVILLGYLISYTMAQVYPSITIVPGKKQAINTTPLTLELIFMDLPVYAGKRLEAFSGRVLRPKACLSLALEEDKRIAFLGFNDPIRFHGYTLFLQRFSPHAKSSISKRRYIVLDVRRDPGVFLYFIGIACFLSGMFGYIFFNLNSKTLKGTV